MFVYSQHLSLVFQLLFPSFHRLFFSLGFWHLTLLFWRRHLGTICDTALAQIYRKFISLATDKQIRPWGDGVGQKLCFKSTAIVLSSVNTKEYGGYRRREQKMGKASYFFHVNARLLVFLSMRSPFTLGKNGISFKILDWKA